MSRAFIMGGMLLARLLRTVLVRALGHEPFGALPSERKLDCSASKSV